VLVMVSTISTIGWSYQKEATRDLGPSRLTSLPQANTKPWADHKRLMMRALQWLDGFEKSMHRRKSNPRGVSYPPCLEKAFIHNKKHKKISKLWMDGWMDG
jgi:hypothetical protein